MTRYEPKKRRAVVARLFSVAAAVALMLVPADAHAMIDGVTDASDPAGHRFGAEHLRRTILEQPGARAADTIAALELAIDTFASKAVPYDDIAMVVVSCLNCQTSS